MNGKTNINDSKRPVQNPAFRLQTVNNEYMLYNATEESALYINETAAIIWKMCEKAETVGEIKKLLLDSYPGAKDDIAQDVDEVLDGLCSHGALSLS